MLYSILPRWIPLTALILAVLSIAGSGWAAEPAEVPGILLIALKGRVKFQRTGTQVYVNATTNTVLHQGDVLSTAVLSEATLQFADKSIGRVKQMTDLLIGKPGQQAGSYEIDVRGGGYYLINRDKAAEQNFKTPGGSGAILGTEFAVDVDPDGTTLVSLFEGSVEFRNEFGRVALAPREQARIERGRAPVRSPMVDLIAPIQWTLYYPGVLPPAAVSGVGPGLRDPAAAYASGDLIAAIAFLDGSPAPAAGVDRLFLAQLALAAGQPPEALRLLEGITGPDAEALRTVIATVQGHPPAEGPSGSPAALLAASHAAQARLDLGTALRLAREAVAADPAFGFAWVRVAELEFSFGHAGAARGALETALKQVPRDAQALALQGFVSAARNRVEEARGWFEQALAVDPHLGNAWLGRGLCRIKQGDVAGGRRDLQTAAAMEPTRSVTRSYLGKAFAAEHDPARAAHELERAQELDPNDPTSWLYGALVRQQANRLNEAVSDLEQSKALNDQRNLYRSRQLLDQDRAVRGANLAAVYRDAGMSDWAVREAGRAVQYDYANASAHLFLASAYDALRDPRGFNLRYETPWFSELLMANLLAPVGAGPLSQNISLQDYSRLLESDRLGFSNLTEFYGNGTWNERASQFGTFGGSSYSVDVEYRHEAGFVPNTDLTQTTVYGKIKQQFGESDLLFVEVIYTQNENGDNVQYYDPHSASPTYRFRERQEPNLFVGWNHEWSPGNHTLLLAGHLDDRVGYSDSGAPLPLIRHSNSVSPANALIINSANMPKYALAYESDFTAWTAELQQIATLGPHTLVAGGRYQAGDSDTVASQAVLPNQLPVLNRQTNNTETVNARLGRVSAYLYDTWQVHDPLQLYLTGGVSYEWVEHPENIDFAPIQSGGRHSDLIAPKLGLLWTIRTNTHLRAAWTKSLGGTFYDTSIRLEPVQVAGFTQAFRSLAPESVTGLVPGTEFETVSAGIDHQFPTHTYIGVTAEWLRSDANQTVGAFDFTAQGRFEVIPSSVQLRLPYDERSVQVNLNQLLGEQWSAGLSYRWSEADLDQQFEAPYAALPKSPNRSYQAVLHQVNGLLQYAHRCGFYAQFISRWNGQTVRGFPGQPGDDFWQFDTYAGYRFAQRRVDVRLGVLNLTDRDYRLQPLNVHEEYPRERMFYASLRLQF